MKYVLVTKAKQWWSAEIFSFIFKRETVSGQRANLASVSPYYEIRILKSSFVLDPKLLPYTEIIGKCTYSYRTKKSTQHFIKITVLLGNCLTLLAMEMVFKSITLAQGNKIGCNFLKQGLMFLLSSWSFCSWCFLPPRQTQVHTSSAVSSGYAHRWYLHEWIEHPS